MKKLLLISVILVALFSCDEEKGEAVCANAEFVFVNQSGEDVFNPNTPNHLGLSEFEVYANDSINRLNFTDTLNGRNVFDVWLCGEIDMEGTTFFKFGSVNVDTLYAKFEQRGNSLFISELYYNGKLIEQNDGVGQCGTKVHEIVLVED